MNTQTSPAQPRVLVIDDNAAIHDDFRKILAGQTVAGTRLGSVEAALFGGSANQSERVLFRIDSAHQGREALAMVQKAQQENDPYVLAFVDVRMPPGWDGVETLEHIWQCCPELQAVICTAYSDYSWDDVARRLGQTDSLLILKKPFETVEVLQMAHSLSQKWALARQARLRMEDLDRMVRERTQELVAANQKLQQEIEERTRVQEALRVSEEQFSKAFTASPMSMAIKSCPEGRFQAANSSFLELTGYTASQLLQRTSDELRLWEDATGKKTYVMHPKQRLRDRQCMLRRSDGAFRNAMLWAEPITLVSGPCVLLIVEDVTEQLRLEGQLRQAQKMEAVGRLAAGIAHEFNNILTVIQGHAGLLRARPADPRVVAESTERIAQASQRATSLTKQLLALGRKQPLQFSPVNLSGVVQATQRILGRLLGERYELRLDCAADLPPARADEGSVEQILINLALNARDAMPGGGSIQVGTSLTRCDETVTHKNPEARPGCYVCLTVSDAGCGMSPEVLNRIFDPFFTTRETGKSSGLGLSTIHGIVQQHKGWVELDSEVGRGSTFRVFLPVWEGKPAPVAKADRPRSPRRRDGEAVLIVEDEVGVRELARAALERSGYHVFEAADGHLGLQVWEHCPRHINLLVTDVVLPSGMSGGDLARTLLAKEPQLRVIYTSGYSLDIVEQDVPLIRSKNFLPKPYDADTLLEAVKRCLDSDGHAQDETGDAAVEDLAATV